MSSKDLMVMGIPLYAIYKFIAMFLPELWEDNRYRRIYIFLISVFLSILSISVVDTFTYTKAHGIHKK